MKTVIFDFDGTLADTVAINHQIMNQLAQQFKFKTLTLEDIKRLKELPAVKVLKFMGIKKYKIPFVMMAGKKKLHEHIDSIPLSAEFKQLLNQLSQCCRLGVVSTNSNKNVTRFLTHHQVTPFDFVYADARLSGKARMLKKALKKQQIAAADCVYVGDEIRDIQAANKAGLKVIAVTWGYNTKRSLEKHSPTYMADDIAGLSKALKAFGI